MQRRTSLTQLTATLAVSLTATLAASLLPPSAQAQATLDEVTRLVLPPALGRVGPALVSQSVIVMLGSAVCGQISAQELSYAANLIQSRNFRAFEACIIATAIYLGLSIGVRALLNWVGPRFIFGRLPNMGH